MKKLNKKEWIAVTVAMFVVGFFFVFGQTLISTFNNKSGNNIMMSEQSRLQIQDELVGGGEIAAVGNSVIVHYTGRFVNGDVFDSSVSRGEPFQFILGSGLVIKGWDEGIVGMRVGGKRILTVPPEFGYGMNDYGPIPGGSTLIFEVELLKVEK